LTHNNFLVVDIINNNENKNSFKQILKGFTFAAKNVWTVSKKYAIFQTLYYVLSACITPISTLIDAWIISMLTQSYGLGVSTSLFLYIVLAVTINRLMFRVYYAFTNIIYKRINSTETAKITFHVKSQLYDKMSNIDSRLFNDPEFNTEIELAMAKPHNITESFNNGLQIVNNLIGLTGNIAIMMMIAWWLPVITMACLIPSIILANYYEKIRKKHEEETRMLSRKAHHANGVLFNNEFVEEGKIFGFRNFFADMWSNNMDGFYVKRRQLSTRRVLIDLLSAAFSALGSIFCIGVAIYRVLNGYIGVEMIAVGINIIVNMSYSLNYFNNYIFYFLEAHNDSYRIRKFLEKTDNITEVSGSVKLGKIDNIRFDNVYFSYKNDEIKAIDNITFEINDGEYIAFAGLNGSGKTTLIKLLCGIYTPSSGTIYYNDIPHDEIDRKNLQSHFSTLYQDYAKYALTLRENITLSEEEETEIKKLDYVLLKSGASSVVDDCLSIEKNDKINVGIETKLQPDVLTDAKDLSIGQWQKVATARSMYHTKQFIIMDEPSSAIDPLAERDIYNAVKEFEGFSTKLIISHRLSYMQDTTRIILLEKGRIVEDGSFDELKEKDGVFKYLYDIQADRYNLKDEESEVNA